MSDNKRTSGYMVLPPAGVWQFGPYEVFINDPSAYKTELEQHLYAKESHMVRNSTGATVYAGSKEACLRVKEQCDLSYAAWCMIKDTKAEGT